MAMVALVFSSFLEEMGHGCTLRQGWDLDSGQESSVTNAGRVSSAQIGESLLLYLPSAPDASSTVRF